ncbi:MAG: hypothetical protein M1541_08685, partial [Acidobacteria bacterium]|nr:hypothetical protein [Acidobacteriota bacterium]
FKPWLAGSTGRRPPVPTALGILVQAYNEGDKPLVIQGISVQGNDISGCSGGWYDVGAYIYAIPYTKATLKSVSVVQNTISARRGIYVRSEAPGQVINATVVGNEITCANVDGLTSAAVTVRGALNTKVVNNTASSCTFAVTDLGEKTKIPPGHSKH